MGVQARGGLGSPGTLTSDPNAPSHCRLSPQDHQGRPLLCHHDQHLRVRQKLLPEAQQRTASGLLKGARGQGPHLFPGWGVVQKETEPSALSSALRGGASFPFRLNCEPQGYGAAPQGLPRPPQNSFLPAVSHSQAPRIITFPPPPPSLRPNLTVPPFPPFPCVFAVAGSAPGSHKTPGLV